MTTAHSTTRAKLVEENHILNMQTLNAMQITLDKSVSQMNKYKVLQKASGTSIEQILNN